MIYYANTGSINIAVAAQEKLKTFRPLYIKRACSKWHVFEVLQRCKNTRLINRIASKCKHVGLKTAGPLRYHCAWIFHLVYYEYPNSKKHFFPHSFSCVKKGKAMCYLEGEESKSTCSYYHSAPGSIRMHIDNRTLCNYRLYLPAWQTVRFIMSF